MTKRQKFVLRSLRESPGGFLRYSKTVTGRKIFRLYDGKINPLGNFQERSMETLYRGRLVTEQAIRV